MNEYNAKEMRNRVDEIERRYNEVIALREAAQHARELLWNKLPAAHGMSIAEFRRRTEDARHRGHPWPMAEVIIELDDALAGEP